MRQQIITTDAMPLNKAKPLWNSLEQGTRVVFQP